MALLHNMWDLNIFGKQVSGNKFMSVSKNRKNMQKMKQKMVLIILKHNPFVIGPWVVSYTQFRSFYSLFNDIVI